VIGNTASHGNHSTPESLETHGFQDKKAEEPDQEDHVNFRRANRNIGDGVRLNEQTGTVSTHASRAAARLDRARTSAYNFGIR
jgi:hypothetical protein